MRSGLCQRTFTARSGLDEMVAAAILGAGALGAGASIWGSSNAADAQTNAANAAIANQNAMYDKNKNVLTPFIDAGKGAIGNVSNLLDPNNTSGPLNALMKLVMPGADQTATLEQTPGYQFNLSQGLRASNNALTARGLGGSGGAVAKGASTFASGLASNTWQSVVNNLQNLFTSNTGAAQNLVNTGAQSGNALAGVGTSTANANSNALIGAGNANAAAYNGIGSAVGGFGNSLSSAALVDKLTGGTGGGLYGSNPAYGGGNMFSGDAWGGSASNPLNGLSASDYGG
jgi:hypothetical protein